MSSSSLKLKLTYDPLLQGPLAPRVPIFDCSNPQTSSATLLNPTSCSQPPHSTDEIHNGALLYLPDPEQQDMKVCKITFSITGEVCGRWSIVYPNLQHSEAVKITKTHCQALHHLKETTLDEVPLHQESSTGAFTALTVTPKRVG